MRRRTSDELGEVHPERLYTRDTIMERLDISQSALRAMEHSGLKALRVGKRKFYKGAAVIQFMEAAAK